MASMTKTGRARAIGMLVAGYSLQRMFYAPLRINSMHKVESQTNCIFYSDCIKRSLILIIHC